MMNKIKIKRVLNLSLCSVVAVLLSGCLTTRLSNAERTGDDNSHKIVALEKELGRLQRSIGKLTDKNREKQREINVLAKQVRQLQQKLKGIRFIVDENTIQIDSEVGYPIPRRYHRGK